MTDPESDQPPYDQEANGGSLPSIEALSQSLGFIETPELESLKIQCIEADDAETYHDAITRYREWAEEVARQYDDPRVQIGLIVQMALIRRDAGKLDVYVDDIEAARNYAYEMGLDHVVSILEAEMEPTSERLVHVCRDVLPDEDVKELAAMPLDEAFNYAVTLLVANGEDPDIFLRDKGIWE